MRAMWQMRFVRGAFVTARCVSLSGPTPPTTPRNNVWVRPLLVQVRLRLRHLVALLDIHVVLLGNQRGVEPIPAGCRLPTPR